MKKIEYKQAVYADKKFDHWHYWGFMPDLSFIGPDMVNGIAHALANSHPYICPDKNGDKVFAGDETNHGAVAWNTGLFAWTLLENIEDMLGDGEVTGITNLLSDYKKEDIELIKDSDND